ncbi:hypothetical protein [Mucilaginibacter boryungensis]|uniref:Uncharacterized protein n=1 Tax=Mucilaginibacter boryungensis TaxID=768480 RepID=A0ABR9XLD8_9SPHI|nr:hypothetical protein [Mucilaginibacter boryungensis]MBE9667825.1 hypothetical protein [Mucilaginibacter boryungensis]
MDKVINPSDIKAKIQEHLNKAKELQAALDVIMSIFPEEKVEKPAPQPYDFSGFKPVLRNTFKNTILGILRKEDKPLTVRQALSLYQDETHRDIVFPSFSGQFSILNTKEKAIKKIIFPNNPIEDRFYYGLPEWFNGNVLKQEYMKKIKAG